VTRRLLDSARAGAGAGALLGSLAFGLPVALATIAHNRLATPLDAAWLALGCVAIYGAAGATAVAAGAALAAALRKQSSGLGAGLWLLLAAFALGFFLHGLTYDQVPVGSPSTAVGMLAYVALFGLAIVAGAGLVARGLRSVLAPTRRLGRAIVVTIVASPLVAAATAALQPDAPGPAPVQPQTTLETRGGVQRLALVGLDGADWQVLRPLIERGELPHFARLIADGVSGSLQTIPDSNSAVIWASLYTGQRPERHRVLDFFRVYLPGMSSGVFPVHRTYFQEASDRLARLGLARLRPISRLDLDAAPIWEITDHLGIPTGLVDGYYYSFPAPRFATAGGYAVAYGTDGFWQQVRRPGSGARVDDVGLFVQPRERLREIRDHLGGADFDWQSASTLTLLATQPIPRFLSVYTHEPDTVQHLEWKWYEPRKYPFARPEDVAARGDRIPERYRAFDRFLGALRERLGPEAVIMVASDHGHSPTLLHPSYYTQHRHGPPGVFLAAGGPLRRGAALPGDASIYDLFPTLLHLLGLPIPEDAAGRLLAAIFEPSALAAEPPRSIVTYEGRWPRQVAADVMSGLEAEELEKLRALGYL
jgi:hypothetical protein